MRVLTPFALCLCLLSSTMALASNDPIGVIVATSGTSKNNTNTAAPFTIKHQNVEVQCDVAVCVAEGLDSSTAASCATHLEYEAKTIIPVRFKGPTDAQRVLAVVPAIGSATATCKVVTPL